MDHCNQCSVAEHIEGEQDQVVMLTGPQQQVGFEINGQKDVIFEQEKTSGGAPKLKAASLEKIIELLTSDTYGGRAL